MMVPSSLHMIAVLALLHASFMTTSDAFQFSSRYNAASRLTRHIEHCPSDHSSSALQSRRRYGRCTAPTHHNKIGKLYATDDTSETDEPVTIQSPLVWGATLVLPLWLVYISNQWSRFSLSYLVDFSPDALANPNDNAFYAMNIALNFNEAQYGVLASVAFTTLYALATIVAGAAADRYNRRNLTVAAAVGWSLATLGTALAQNYTTVLICRVIMGLACAFSTPTAYTLIQERVPQERVALASSLYGTGVAVASALASLSLLLDQRLGWSQTLVILAGFGLVGAALTGVLVENDPKDVVPKNNSSRSNVTASSGDIVKDGDITILQDILATLETTRMKWLYSASFLRFCSGLCIGVWGAPYYRMVFSDQQSEYAVVQAVISAVGASLSGIAGGVLADKLATSVSDNISNNNVSNNILNTDASGRRLWIPMVGSLLAVPTWYASVNSSESFTLAMTWLALEYLVAECWFGPTISTILTTVTENNKKLGGTAQGVFTLTGAIGNLAPTVMGTIYGSYSGGEDQASALAAILSAGVCLGYIGSAFCFGMAAISTPVSKVKAE